MRKIYLCFAKLSELLSSHQSILIGANYLTYPEFHHKEEIEAGDHHDPNALELFCEMHPDEPECLVYDD